MEPPADLMQYDNTTMPITDPAVEAKLLKEMEKARKQQEADAKKAEKAQRQRAAPAPKAQADAPPAAKHGGGTDKAAQKREMKAHKIRLYFAKLGHKLTVKEPKVYPRTDEALDELLTSIETELHSNGGIEKAGLMYVQAVAGIEQVMPVFNPLGWQLSGPAASLGQTVMSNREQWEELVTEFAISNAEWFMVGPGKRLIATTVQLILAVDGANKAAMAQSRAAPEDLKQKGEDL